MSDDKKIQNEDKKVELTSEGTLIPILHRDEIPTDESAEVSTKEEVGNEKNIEEEAVDEQTTDLTELEILSAQCEEYKAGWMRAQADYQNLQKEVESKRGEWIKMSEVQILVDFIPVYDNFKKAFADHTDTQIYADVADNADNEKVKRWNNWKKGIEYIMKQFGDVLRTYNIEEIKTVGEMFNPELHEAVGEEEAEGKEAGEIIREVDAGYKIGDRVIKVAKVILSKENCKDKLGCSL